MSTESTQPQAEPQNQPTPFRKAKDDPDGDRLIEEILREVDGKPTPAPGTLSTEWLE